jgi:hypothetical protein
MTQPNVQAPGRSVVVLFGANLLKSRFAPNQRKPDDRAGQLAGLYKLCPKG